MPGFPMPSPAEIAKGLNVKMREAVAWSSLNIGHPRLKSGRKKMPKTTFRTPLAAVLSLLTGRMIPVGESGGFSEMHELAEFIGGRPIWTHEFASKELAEKLCTRLKIVLPDELANVRADEVHDEKSAKQFLLGQIEKWGEYIEFNWAVAAFDPVSTASFTDTLKNT